MSLPLFRRRPTRPALHAAPAPVPVAVFPYYVVMTNPQGGTAALGHPTKADAIAAWKVVANCGWRVRVVADSEWRRIQRRIAATPGATLIPVTGRPALAAPPVPAP